MRGGGESDAGQGMVTGCTLREASLSMPGIMKSKPVNIADSQHVSTEDEDYPAYHTNIEETAVEIVPRQTPGREHQRIDSV